MTQKEYKLLEELDSLLLELQDCYPNLDGEHEALFEEIKERAEELQCYTNSLLEDLKHDQNTVSESVRKLLCIQKEYDTVVFNCALTQLLTERSNAYQKIDLVASKAEIEAENSKNNGAIIGTDFMMAIHKCAHELAMISPLKLVNFISNYM